jgi:hypothetical protein
MVWTCTQRYPELCLMRHRFHALCPYFAMFPEAFVETWVERLTKPGQLVLDPFCGRGTTPFQALLMNRKAVASDINPVAYCITRAKTNAPTAKTLRRRLNELEKGFDHAAWESQRRRMHEFFHDAYSPRTLRQLLYLRHVLRWEERDSDCMIAALTLGSLHGETERSKHYLSNQMPRTISTKPAYSVRYWREHDLHPPERDVFALLRNRVTFRYESDVPRARGVVHRTDMRELPRVMRVLEPIRCVITSPPYLDVTNFEEDQWLRLWFLGGPARPTYRLVSQDDRHENAADYWGLISDLWRVLGQVLAPRADIVIRIGGRSFDFHEMGERLQATSVFSRRKSTLVHSEVSPMRRKQTSSFRPASKGCMNEADFQFRLN